MLLIRDEDCQELLSYDTRYMYVNFVNVSTISFVSNHYRPTEHVVLA